MFIWLRVRFDGLFGRFPIGKRCFENCMFFSSFLFVITFQVGNLFMEPDLREFRVYVVALSFRWFVW